MRVGGQLLLDEQALNGHVRTDLPRAAWGRGVSTLIEVAGLGDV